MPVKLTVLVCSATWLLVDNDLRPDLGDVVKLSDWTRVRTIRRPSDNNEDVTLYHRRQP